MSNFALIGYYLLYDAYILCIILIKATIRKPLSNYKNIKLNQMTSLYSLRVSVHFGNKIRQGMNAKELISQETTANSSRWLGLGLGLGFVMSHDPPGTNIRSLVLVCEMIWFEPYD